MSNAGDDLDELLQPTITGTRRPAERPWRLQSQFWVAFFGGVPAITIIAYLNAGRLGASRRKQNLILLSGIVAALALVATAAFIGLQDEYKRTIRFAGRVIAVVLYLVVAAIQRNDDRHYQTLGAGEYASLWGPGFLAMIGGAVISLAIGAVIVLLAS